MRGHRSEGRSSLSAWSSPGSPQTQPRWLASLAFEVCVFPVATVIAMVADGMTNEEILAEHPDLEAGDITEALKFAGLAVQERQLPLLSA